MWKLDWLDDNCEYIHFKMEGRTELEFALKPPEHAKLYYALKDWFGD